MNEELGSYTEAVMAENDYRIKIIISQRDEAIHELSTIKDECIDHTNLYKAWTKERDILNKELSVLRELLQEIVTIPYRDNLLGRVYAALEKPTNKEQNK